jgi:hypothetical protein
MKDINKWLEEWLVDIAWATGLRCAECGVLRKDCDCGIVLLNDHYLEIQGSNLVAYLCYKCLMDGAVKAGYSVDIDTINNLIDKFDGEEMLHKYEYENNLEKDTVYNLMKQGLKTSNS